MIDKIKMKKAEWWKEKDVLIAGLVVGVLSHLYMLTNKIPNIDDYISMFHYGGGYTSGRWLLALIGNFMFRIDGNYSLPFLNGTIFILLLSLSIMIFLKPFQFHSRWVKRIFAGLFVAFPTVTATMGFMFTVPFYGIAVLFMAIAFYILITYKYGFLFSIFLICFSLGIYQAYWGLVATFLLLYLIGMCMEVSNNNAKIVIHALKSLVALFLGVVFYLVINNLMLHFQGLEMSEYQGLNQMAQFEFSKIPGILRDAYINFFRLITDNYMYITWYGIIRGIIGFGYMITAVLCIIALIYNRKEMFKNIALIIFTVILPLAVNSIYIMCNEASSVHTLMCYSVVLVFFMPFVFMNGVGKLTTGTKLLCLTKCIYLVCVMLVTFFYVRFANIYYLNLELAFHETYSFMETLSTRIQEVDGYTDEVQIYFHGAYSHDINRSLWELRMVNQMSGTVDVSDVINSPLIRKNYFRVYLGNSLNEVSDVKLMEECYSVIEEMPSYPNDCSIVIINDIIVVKLSD